MVFAWLYICVRTFLLKFYDLCIFILKCLFLFTENFLLLIPEAWVPFVFSKETKTYLQQYANDHFSQTQLINADTMIFTEDATTKCLLLPFARLFQWVTAVRVARNTVPICVITDKFGVFGQMVLTVGGR